jgi:hypothetical protein
VLLERELGCLVVGVGLGYRDQRHWVKSVEGYRDQRHWVKSVEGYCDQRHWLLLLLLL